MENQQEEQNQNDNLKSDTQSLNKQVSKRGYMGPIILIALGVIFLLMNLGLNINWSYVWPILIIIIGLFMLLNKGSIGGWVVGLIILIIIIGLAFTFVSSDFAEKIGLNWNNITNDKIDTTTKQIDIDKESYPDIEQIDLNIDIGAGEYELSNIKSESTLFESTSRYNYEHLAPVVDQSLNEKTLSLNFHTENSNVFNIFDLTKHIAGYNLNLSNPEIKTNFDLDLGSGKADVNLTNQNISEFKANTSSGEMDITLSGENKSESTGKVELSSGELSFSGIGNGNFTDINFKVSSGDMDLNFDGAYIQKKTNSEIDVSSGSIDIDIPSNVGIKISPSISSGSVSIDNKDIDDNEEYVSDNYEDAKNKIDFEIDISSGSIDFDTN